MTFITPNCSTVHDSGPPVVPLTVHDIVQMCLRFAPKQAAETNNSALCVTPLITCVHLDGKTVDLALVEGKWTAHYARVSDIKQRTQSEEVDVVESVNRNKGDGNSEAEQIERGIRHCLSMGHAFKIYSDAAVSGDFPTHSVALIRRMLNKKAQRYKRNFTAILMDPVSMQRYTPPEAASLQAFLARRLAEIQRDGLEEEEQSSLLMGAEAAASGTQRRHGRPSRRAYHRQGLSQLWSDGREGRVHTITMGEESRLCRDADLYILFLEMVQAHQISLKGLTHAVADLDVTQPMARAVSYLLASVHEERLREISQHTFRGKVQSLRAGKPQGILPWYTRKGVNGFAVLIPQYVQIAQRMIHLSLSGMGTARIQKTLQSEGARIEGKALTKNQIETLLTTDAMLGLQHHFGLTWRTLPPIVEEATWEALQAGRGGRRERMNRTSGVHDTRQWANHLLTGIAHCWCGRSARRRFVYEYRAGKRTGVRHEYYDCSSVDREEPHICVRASVLESFVEDLVRHNPDVLTGAFRTGGNGTQAQRQAQRCLLEARVQAAEAHLAQQAQEVQAVAQERADKTGLASGSPYYATILAGLMDSLLETPCAALAQAQQELQHLRAQIVEDQRETCLAQHRQQAGVKLGQLQQWDDLEVFARNALLKTVFSQIVVHTPERGGRLELFLHGLDTPLPAVPLRRGVYRTLLLPTVAEWLALIFSL